MLQLATFWRHWVWHLRSGSVKAANWWPWQRSHRHANCARLFVSSQTPRAATAPPCTGATIDKDSLYRMHTQHECGRATVCVRGSKRERDSFCNRHCQLPRYRALLIRIGAGLVSLQRVTCGGIGAVWISRQAQSARTGNHVLNAECKQGYA